MRNRFRIRFAASASLLVLAGLHLGGCASLTSPETTGSIAASPQTPQSEADWRKASEIYGERYRANPKDKEAALRYGLALRSLGLRTQAAAVLEQGAIANPEDRALVAAYGRALVDSGSYQQGFDTLSRAHSPDNPDWHILSIQGTALDRLGKHDEARLYYGNALKIKPDEPSVLSNLGMSYLLSKQLVNAEVALRRAHESAKSDARVRQNLALAVGLQGRTSEAEAIIQADLPADQAKEGVAELRTMLKQGDGQRRRPAARNAEADRPTRS